MEPSQDPSNPLNSGSISSGRPQNNNNTSNMAETSPQPDPTPSVVNPTTSASDTVPPTPIEPNSSKVTSENVTPNPSSPEPATGLPPLDRPVLGVPVTGGPVGPAQPMVSTAPLAGPMQPRRKVAAKLWLASIASLIIITGVFGYVFGIYIPNKPTNVYQTGLNRSGDNLAKLVDKLTTKDQLQKIENSELTASIEAKAADYSFSGNFGVKVAKTKADGNVDIKYKTADQPEKTLNLKFLSDLPDTKKYPNLYFQLNGIKNLGFDAFVPEFAQYDGKWIAIDSDYLESVSSAGDAPKNRENITSEEVASLTKVISDTSNEYLLTTDKDKAVLENKSFVGKEKDDGLMTYHYTVGINKGHAKDYCKALEGRVISHSTVKKMFNLDDKDIEERKKDIDKNCDDEIKNIKDDTTLDLWIDAKYKLIHKLRVYDENDKGNYTDIGQNYTGGDKISFFVAYHGDKRQTDAKMTLDVDMKAYTSKGTITWGQKSGDAYDVTVNFEAKPYSGEVKVEKPANTISIQELLGMFGYDPAQASTNNNSSNSPSLNAKDTERKTDINALHGQLEAYYAQKGIYPTQGDLNNATWRAANMRGLDDEALRDPDGTTKTLASVATTKQYSYAPDKCTKVDNGCQTYTLTALLSTGATYTKQNLN